jgi:S1-C subfamily serine protease
VSRVGNADDVTPVFSTTFSRPTEPGDSGAPVLNARDEAVGIYGWHSVSDRTLGTAISRSALDPVCFPSSAPP